MAAMLGRYQVPGCCPRTKGRRQAVPWCETDEAAPWISQDGWDDSLELVLGECRHGCNGAEIMYGYASGTCDFRCHAELQLDPERAARYDRITGG